MSNDQEMQFADPAWQSSQGSDDEQLEPLQARQYPEEHVPAPPGGIAQDGEAEPEHIYGQGYQAQYTSIPGTQGVPPLQGQPQQPPQQTFSQTPRNQFSRIPSWVWWVIAIIAASSVFDQTRGPVGGLLTGLLGIAVIVVAWLFISRRLRLNMSGEKLPAETRTFAVHDIPTILLSNRAGSIRLHTGQEKQVVITTVKRGYLFRGQPDTNAEVSYAQDSTRNTISAHVSNWRPFGKHTIDFDITVPVRSSLEVSTNAGKITVQGIEGQLLLKTDAGSIDVSQVILQGRSRLKTNAGSITFAGTIAEAGDYELATDLGSVKASLSTDSSFFLDAQTDLGSVSTNLSLVQPQKNKLLGQVGRGPAYPRLRLKTSLGSVDLSQR